MEQLDKGNFTCTLGASTLLRTYWNCFSRESKAETRKFTRNGLL